MTMSDFALREGVVLVMTMSDFALREGVVFVLMCILQCPRVCQRL